MMVFGGFFASYSVTRNAHAEPLPLPLLRLPISHHLGMPGTNPEHARSKLQALVRTLVDAEIAGNARAQSVVVGALARMGDPEESEAPSLTPDDQQILDAYVGGELQRRATEADAAPASTGDEAIGAGDTDDEQSKKRT